MNCRAFENRLQTLLDQRRDICEDTELREHARRCESCAAELQLYRHLFEPDASLSGRYAIVTDDVADSSSLRRMAERNGSRLAKLSGICAACMFMTCVVCFSFLADWADGDASLAARRGDGERSGISNHRGVQSQLALTMSPIEDSKALNTETSEASRLMKHHDGRWAEALMHAWRPGELPIVHAHLAYTRMPHANSNRLDRKRLDKSSFTFWYASIDSLPLSMDAFRTYNEYAYFVPGLRPWSVSLNHLTLLLEHSFRNFDPRQLLLDRHNDFGKGHDLYKQDYLCLNVA